MMWSFSVFVLPWMLLHKNVWIHRDASLIMDLCLDLFYSAIFPLTIAMLAALARGTYMELEREFWGGTVSYRFSLCVCLCVCLCLCFCLCLCLFSLTLCLYSLLTFVVTSFARHQSCIDRWRHSRSGRSRNP